jgi:hypothetical protein
MRESEEKPAQNNSRRGSAAKKYKDGKAKRRGTRTEEAPKT